MTAGSVVLRLVAGFGLGLLLAAVMRWADGVLTGRLDFGTRRGVAAVVMIVGPVMGVLVSPAGAVRGADNASVALAGGFAGLIAGVLYPIE